MPNKIVNGLSPNDAVGVITIYKQIVGDEYWPETEMNFFNKADRKKKLAEAIKSIKNLTGYSVTIKINDK